MNDTSPTINEVLSSVSDEDLAAVFGASNGAGGAGGFGGGFGGASGGSSSGGSHGAGGAYGNGSGAYSPASPSVGQIISWGYTVYEVLKGIPHR